MKEIIPNVDPHTKPSFTVQNRLSRIGWNIVYYALFRYSPRPFHAWRVFILRVFGAKIGRDCHIYPKVKIWAPWHLEVGDESSIADDANCYSMDTILIGHRAVISQGAHLCTGSHDYESHNFQLYAKPITIRDYAWLCADCFISPGVTIYEGAVIGARAVVTHDMPAWMVCAGNPCKPIKQRLVKKK